MKILQKPISNKHKSSMFFDGIIAEGKGYLLATNQLGEIGFIDKEYIGWEIVDLGIKGLIDDDDINAEKDVDIFVDRFICIYRGEPSDGNLIDDGQLYFTNYDEAIEGFKEFLNRV